MRAVHIYVLRDPRSNEVRYVGKTIQALEARLGAHIRRSKEVRTHRDCWIKGLVDAGLKPIIESIECVSGDWAIREKFWIAHFREASQSLTNQTEGGDGLDPSTASRLWTPERKARQSKITAEMNRRRVGQSWSEERKRLQSKAQKKRWQNSQRRAEMAQTMTRVVSTPGYRSRMSTSCARAWTPERRERQSAVAARVNAKRWGCL